MKEKRGQNACQTIMAANSLMRLTGTDSLPQLFYEILQCSFKALRLNILTESHPGTAAAAKQLVVTDTEWPDRPTCGFTREVQINLVLYSFISKAPMSVPAGDFLFCELTTMKTKFEVRICVGIVCRGTVEEKMASYI